MPKPRTIVQKRLLDAADLQRDGDVEVAFQHTIFCQVSLPYRDPGNDVRLWKRSRGGASGNRGWSSLSPGQGRLRRRRPAVRAQGATDPGFSQQRGRARWLAGDRGRGQLDCVREPPVRLTIRRVRTAGIGQGPARRVWPPPTFAWLSPMPRITRDRSRHRSSAASICGSKTTGSGRYGLPRCRLSHDYFVSLQRHAVPLDERALAALSHSAMALDLYAWLAQRLHRVPKPHRQLVPWVSLQEQFGQGYDRYASSARCSCWRCARCTSSTRPPSSR